MSLPFKMPSGRLMGAACDRGATKSVVPRKALPKAAQWQYAEIPMESVRLKRHVLSGGSRTVGA